MGEENQNTEENNTQGEKTKEMNVNVTVDPTQMTELMTRLKKEEELKEKAQEELKKALGEKDDKTKELEEKAKAHEDAITKLNMIAEKELEAKKTAIMTKAKEFIKDEDRLRIIEEGIKTLEDVKSTEFMMDTLATTLKQGAQEATDLENQTKEANASEDEANRQADPTSQESSGSLPLAGQTSNTGEGYESHAAMIRDLRKRSHSADPEVRAEAEAILKELFRKWVAAVKKDYDNRMPRGIQVEKGPEQPSLREMTREGGAALEKPTKKRTGDE